MEINNNNSYLLEGLLVRQTTPSNALRSASTPALPSKDIVALSEEKSGGLKTKASRLLSEDVEKIDNGFRRVQTFETPKGGKFTRIEEHVNTPDRSKRLVIQKNESGSTTILENILDRQDNGTFRQTQRFTNEVGETSTDIKLNVAGSTAEQLLGLPPQPNKNSRSPFEPVRGTQYNVVV